MINHTPIGELQHEFLVMLLMSGAKYTIKQARNRLFILNQYEARRRLALKA